MLPNPFTASDSSSGVPFCQVDWSETRAAKQHFKKSFEREWRDYTPVWKYDSKKYLNLLCRWWRNLTRFTLGWAHWGGERGFYLKVFVRLSQCSGMCWSVQLCWCFHTGKMNACALKLAWLRPLTLNARKEAVGQIKKKSKKFLLAQSLALVMSKCLEQTSIHDNSSSGIQNAMLFIIVSGFSVTN